MLTEKETTGVKLALWNMEWVNVSEMSKQRHRITKTEVLAQTLRKLYRPYHT